MNWAALVHLLGQLLLFTPANFVPDPAQVRRQGHRLVKGDGTPFYPLGENRMNVFDPTWNYGGKSIDQYLAYMKSNGMNTLRVFLYNDCGDGERLGCLEPRPGEFDERTAREIDRIFEAATREDLYVILVPWAIGFTPGDAWKGWEHNPYSKARGGPAANPAELFTRPELRAVAERRLAYIAHRWGRYSHLLAMDLLNEPEWDGPIAEKDWMPWAKDAARLWRKHDPAGHLVTVGSVGLQHNIGEGDERPWYGSAENDVVQWHLYGQEYYPVHQLAAGMTRKIRETNGFGKPVLVGEFGYGGEDKRTYDHTHVGIWSALFSGAGALAHSAPPFQIDSDEPMTPERGAHFRVLSEFLRSFPTPLDPVDGARASGGVTVWQLRSQEATALWLLAPAGRYGGPVSTEVTVEDLPSGRYRLEWIDDLTGSRVAEVETVVRGRWSAVTPRFSRHLAARLSRIDGSEHSVK
jgi:hypothetical protein